MKKVLIIFTVAAAGIWLLVHFTAINRQAKVEKRYEDLSHEYLHPNFSAEFCRYWGIADVNSYKAALKQQFDKAGEDEMAGAYGRDKNELVYFFHLRMNNWMERELILRAERLREFNSRGNAQTAAFSIDLQPLPK